MRKPLVAAWIAVTALILIIVAAAPRLTHVDFVAFYCAGQAITLHADPYREMPLNSCEHGVTPDGLFATGATVPAPLPPYALLPFSILSLVDFQPAFWLFMAATFIATALGCLLCARLSGAPLLIAIALAAPTVWDNWLKGQPVPFSFLALTVAGFLLTKGRDRWAAFAALGTLVQPQIGLAVCASLFLWRPRTRITLALSVGAFAIASLAAVSPSTLIAYFRTVLPLHAQSEARWIFQLSAASPLTALGVPVGLALSIAAAQQAVTTGLGVLAAGIVARKHRTAELLVFFPALAATIGGTYEHSNALLIALPATLVICRVTGRKRVYIAACAALLTWLGVGGVIAAVLMSLALFTIATTMGLRWQWALAAPAACIVLSVVAAHMDSAPHVIHGIIPVVASDYAEVSWATFVAGVNPAPFVLLATCALKIPTWLGLGILFILPMQRIPSLDCAHGHRDLRRGPPQDSPHIRVGRLSFQIDVTIASLLWSVAHHKRGDSPRKKHAMSNISPIV